jgi:succinate dehydrogenase/fumarate reductase flavoprotein subunit
MNDVGRQKSGATRSWDVTADVIVVGYGYAGGVAAIEAHDAGAQVLLLEKRADPGGISITSGGNVRCAADADEAFAYLQATNAGTTPADVLRVLAGGLTQMRAYFEKLAKVSNATLDMRQADGNYPLPGTRTFGYVSIGNVPDFDAAATYPYVSSYVPIHRAAGVRLFRVIEDNIAARALPVWLETEVVRLETDGDAVVGVNALRNGKVVRIRARRAVVLACGGFEANEEMKRQFWQEKPVLPAAYTGNTGDGIRMAQDVGAALWHMWHYHGVYGFKHPDPDYPVGIRPKRLPDWIPGEATRPDVKMPWIVVDRTGRRFMNEYPPYMQDTSARPMALFDPIEQSFPRIPSFMILDEPGRQLFPLCSPTFNDRRLRFQWSEETLRRMEMEILRKAGTVSELAEGIGVEPDRLQHTLDGWNRACDHRLDDEFSRPGTSMVRIETPPFYYAELWPICSNTHGGPVHDAEQRVLNSFGEPIPRLFAAGELGGVFGHLYISGGNLAECFVGGWVAGRNAAECDGNHEAGAATVRESLTREPVAMTSRREPSRNPPR